MTAPSGAPRLNLVVIQTDDQGPWAVPWRMPELSMPHLATLAAESLELTRFYCASPVCSPARASVLTGRVPSAHGVHDWLIGTEEPSAFPDHYLDGQPTTGEALARAGYQCLMSGKWHVGDSRTPAPGFERWYAHRFGGGPYLGAPVWRDGEPVREERYLTTAITDEAVTMLRERDRDRPFYLQVNYTAPHTPWLTGHPDAYTSRYAGCDFPSVPREPRHPWAVRDDFDASYADPLPSLVGYCAALSAVDDGIGRIRQTLADTGAAASTVVVFMSDNGFSCGHHGIWGKGNGTWPLNLWDSSVRVPFVAHVPGGARGVSEALVSATSLHATLCDLAGVDLPPDRWRAGESVADLLLGRTDQGAEAVVVTSEYGGARLVTDGRWAYVHRHHGLDELYDHATDPQERTDLAADPAHAATRDRLRQVLEDWYAPRERADASAWGRHVTGFGQVHPVHRGRPDHETYASDHAPHRLVRPPGRDW